MDDQTKEFVNGNLNALYSNLSNKIIESEKRLSSQIGGVRDELKGAIEALGKKIDHLVS